jgi:hypothetical protein
MDRAGHIADTQGWAEWNAIHNITAWAYPKISCLSQNKKDSWLAMKQQSQRQLAEQQLKSSGDLLLAYYIRDFDIRMMISFLVYSEGSCLNCLFGTPLQTRKT